MTWDLHELGGTAQAPEPAGDSVGRLAGTTTPLAATAEGVEAVCLGWIGGRGLLTLTLQPGRHLRRDRWDWVPANPDRCAGPRVGAGWVV